MSIFGSNGCLRDITTAILGRICSGPIQTESFTNGDKEDYENAMGSHLHMSIFLVYPHGQSGS